MHNEEEDLHSLLKDLLGAIKDITTDKINTKVNGGLVVLAPSGSVPIAGASGNNPGVGLSPASTQKLDEIAQRLDKLLKKRFQREQKKRIIRYEQFN